ncbi:unnamed protein product [Leptidea sinapis]|nr:unnamed protein product [Leptidea sinapis]
MAMFGNKSDLEHQRAVRLSSVTAFGADHSLEKFKGSARTGEMVNAAFTTLIARVMGAKVSSLVAPVSQLPVREVPERENQPQEEASELIMNRAALRQVQKKESTSVLIEKYTENVRFCIICNYLGKIIPALQSRCTRFRFAPLQQNQIISDDGIKALLTLSGGDMRKVLNTLQSTWLAYRDVTEDNVYTCVGHPLRSDINNIQDLKILKGLALGDILTEIHTIIQRLKLPPEVLISLLIKMAESEVRLSSGCSERIELAALIAAFQEAREKVNIEELVA